MIAVVRDGAMKKREPFSQDALDHDKRVSEALEAAHKLPSGPQRIEALKKAALLSSDAEAYTDSNDLKSPD